MADYLVLARKYRSATFDEVVGQEPISTTLTNAIKTGRVAHAFLFTGTRGVGKTSMARILAKALNCLSFDSATATPCNTCEACIAISRGDDIDVIEIDGASNRGIEEIRDLRRNASLHPARCRYKIYYIDEVHMLTKEAFNALLKTLEEPPAHVKFIFATTEAEKVPATIISRCQRFDFRNISTVEIAGHLANICKAEKIPISEGAVFRVAKAAAGSMRDGISLLDQLISSVAGGQLEEHDVLRVLGTPPDERIGELMKSMSEGQTGAALGQLDDVLAAGYPLEGVVESLADQFRNVMLALTCGSDSKLIELPETQRLAMAELSKKYTVPAAVHAVGVCEQLGRNIRGSSSARALTEAAIVRLAAADKFVDAASLIARLEQLAAGGGGAAPAPRGTWSGGTHAATGHSDAAGPGGPPKKHLVAVPPATSIPGGAATDARSSAAVAQPPGDVSPAGQGGAAPVAPAANAPPASSRAGQGTAKLAIQWNVEWLTAHWSAVLLQVVEVASPSVAGALTPAKVLAVEPDALRLGFDTEFEPMRTRAITIAPRITEAFSQLAGQPMRCELVSTCKSNGQVAAINGQALRGVSSEERKQIANDPAVRAVVEMFNGELTDIRPDVQPGTAPAPVPADAVEPAQQPAVRHDVVTDYSPDGDDDE